MSRPTATLAFTTLLAAFLASPAHSAPPEPQRYPYDPACPWGRIADGRGIIVRCLTQQEAQRLLSSAPANVATSGRPEEKAPGSSPPAHAPTPTPATGAAAAEELLAELVSVEASEGELPVARKKLALPTDRYVACVREHGGLSAESGQVEIRFLVQALGRAEGASAEKYRGMSAEAAQCIAAVVDRRPAGTPAAPMVEAVATIAVKRKRAR